MDSTSDEGATMDRAFIMTHTSSPTPSPVVLAKLSPLQRKIYQLKHGGASIIHGRFQLPTAAPSRPVQSS